jgi:hypothetical protein
MVYCSARPSTMVVYRTRYLFTERWSPAKSTDSKVCCVDGRGGLAAGNFGGGRRLQAGFCWFCWDLGRGRKACVPPPSGYTGRIALPLGITDIGLAVVALHWSESSDVVVECAGTPVGVR